MGSVSIRIRNHQQCVEGTEEVFAHSDVAQEEVRGVGKSDGW